MLRTNLAVRVAGAEFGIAGEMRQLPAYFDNPDYGKQGWEMVNKLVYSAAQNYANQNIRVIRVSPIRTYAYTYTHIRVYSIRAYA